MKILIADDDALSRRLLEKTLERVGYNVTSVENGRQAVDQLVRQDAPRLALLDWMMPEIDGTGVCREVRRRRPARLCLYGSAHLQRIEGRRGRWLGVRR